MSFRLRPPAAAVALSLVSLAALSGGATGADSGAEDPCQGPGSGHLLCPNLRVARPTDLYVERSSGGYGYGGGTLLHATSNIRSRGRGSEAEAHSGRLYPDPLVRSERSHE